MDAKEELDLILAGTPEELKGNIPLLLAVVQIVKFYTTLNSGSEKQYLHRKTKPKVTLFFIENVKKTKQVKVQPAVGEVSFRIMDHTAQDLTEQQLVALAKKIKTKFGGKTPFIWHKGKRMLSYTDWESGYQFQVLCNKKESGKALIEQVLDLRGKSPQWEKANYITCDQELKKYPNKPEHEVILQKNRKLPEKRPIVDVEFAYATLSLYGLTKPIILYDRTGLLQDIIP